VARRALVVLADLDLERREGGRWKKQKQQKKKKKEKKTKKQENKGG
jgi:hypothetical protein